MDWKESKMGYSRKKRTFLKYAMLESARPFSFLNGVYGKWCKLDFELYRIHAKK